MITISFFFEGLDGYTEKEYTGESAALWAELDMDTHIKNGGFCMAGYKNRYVLVANLSQLAINRRQIP